MKTRTVLAVSCVAAVLGVCASATSVGPLPNNRAALASGVTIPSSTTFLNGAQLINGGTLSNGSNLVNGGNLINGAQLSNGGNSQNGNQLNNRRALINGPVLPSGISAAGNRTLALMDLAARPLARKD
jgi:hypothetical protein